MKTSTLSATTLLLSFLGIADAWYLTQSAYSGASLTCDIAGLDGCNIVAQSVYSHLFGFPLALYGVFFYAFIFVLSAATLGIPEVSRRLVRLGLFLFGLIGCVASILFVAIQLLLIKAICVYCFGSAFLSILIFCAVVVIWKRERNRVFMVSPDVPFVVS